MSPALIRPVTSGVPLAHLTRRLGLADDVARADVTITGATLDSRQVAPGDLYAALPGFNVHGAAFAADAARLGAVAVLTDQAGAELLSERSSEEPLTVPVVVVDRPRDVLGGVAAQVYGDPSADLTMIGVTGTNGKTTTAYLIDSALRVHGARTGLIGTVETRIGDDRVESVRTTPEATEVHALLAVMRERGVDACVMEVSSHALDLHRVDGVVYDVALFTNLSQDHLDFHQDMESYFRAKASLFTAARARTGVVCVDDEWGRRLATESEVPVVTLSTSDAAADWRVELGPDGAFGLVPAAGGRGLDLVSHLPGTFNVANTALAALALLAIGIEPEAVETALRVPPQVPGRMEVVSAGDEHGPRCIVDFAHTPDAVEAALAALEPSTAGRLIVVLGAGGDRDRGKRPGMGAAAARHADIVIVTDDNPRSEAPADIRAAVMAGARDEVARGTARATELIDGGSRSAAITEAIAIAILASAEGPTGTAGTASTSSTSSSDQVGGGSGGPDTVVVLGKGHEKGQEIQGVKHPFDDRDAVRVALAAALPIGGDA